MTDANPRVLLAFGDNVDDLVLSLTRFPHLLTESAVLGTFLRQAFDSIQTALYEVRPDLRDALGECRKIRDLALWSSKDERAGMALKLPLGCAAQLATYIT